MLATIITACDEKQPQGVAISVTAVPFEQQLSVFEQSQFRATYDVPPSTPDGTDRWQVTWYKDRTTRQRFDVHGQDRDGQQWDLQYFTRGSALIVCGTDPDTRQSSCMQGPGVDSEAAIIIDSLGFPYQLGTSGPRALRNLVPDFSSGLVAGDGQPRFVSGNAAVCYTAQDATPVASANSLEETVDLCFAPSGVLLSRELHSDYEGATFAVTGDISTPSDKDFDLPYPLTVEPTPAN